jgi:uncharacterized protein
MSGNAVWFEIPTTNFERAIKFYEAVFQVKLQRENIGGEMAMFPGDESTVQGALVHTPDYVPNATGATIYLNGGGADLAPALDRAVKAGGKMLVPKTALPPGMGFWAHFIDTEGNRIGLHSME